MKVDKFGAALLVAALMWMVSCTSASTVPPTHESTPTPSPKQVIQKSSARMMALSTANFTLEHEGEGTTELFPSPKVDFRRVTGQVDMPDKFAIKVEGTIAFSEESRGFIEINVVAVGEQAFMSDIINKERWNSIDLEILPFDFADLGNSLGEIIRAARAPAFSGTEKVDGVPSWRVKGTVPSESVTALVPAATPGFDVRLELWIGQAEGLLRKVRIAGQVLSSDDPDIVRILTINSFDEPVDISLP